MSGTAGAGAAGISGTPGTACGPLSPSAPPNPKIGKGSRQKKLKSLNITQSRCMYMYVHVCTHVIYMKLKELDFVEFLEVENVRIKVETW